jgi:hypothetical protein
MYKFLVLQVTIYGSDFSLPQTGSLARKRIFPARLCLYWAGGSKARTYLFTDSLISFCKSRTRAPVCRCHQRCVVQCTVYILSLFSLFSLFYFFRFFSVNFCFTSIFSLNFRLFFLCFRFRFLVFHIEVNHVKSGFFFASKRNEIFA